MNNLTATQRAIATSKIKRQWQWLQQQRANGTVTGAIITRP